MSKGIKKIALEGEEARSADSDTDEPITGDAAPVPTVLAILESLKDEPAPPGAVMLDPVSGVEMFPAREAPAIPREPGKVALPSLEAVLLEIDETYHAALNERLDDRAKRQLQVLCNYATVKLLEKLVSKA